MASNVETDEQRQEGEESETDLEERGKLTKNDKQG